MQAMDTRDIKASHTRKHIQSVRTGTGPRSDAPFERSHSDFSYRTDFNPGQHPRDSPAETSTSHSITHYNNRCIRVWNFHLAWRLYSGRFCRLGLISSSEDFQLETVRYYDPPMFRGQREGGRERREYFFAHPFEMRNLTCGFSGICETLHTHTI